MKRCWLSKNCAGVMVISSARYFSHSLLSCEESNLQVREATPL